MEKTYQDKFKIFGTKKISFEENHQKDLKDYYKDKDNKNDYLTVKVIKFIIFNIKLIIFYLKIRQMKYLLIKIY
jgi:hypothetical protein